MKKNKICLVNPGFYKYSIGGAEVQLYLIALEFIKHNFEVHYITNDVSDFTEIEGIKLYPFTEKSQSIKKAYKNFKKIADSINPDLFYQRGRKLSTFFVGKYAAENKIPFIFSASMDIDCKQLKKTQRLLESNRELINLLSIPVKIQEDIRTLKGMRNADKVLAQSNKQKRLFEENLNINSTIVKNFHTFPGSDLKKANPPIVLWLATIKSWKQPEVFMKLSRELKHTHCHFILAGRMAEKKYRPLIESWEYESEKFKYIEQVDFDKSNELIGQASLFLNTSLMNEGFPNTFIQAWMRKTPTITLNFDPDNIIKKNNLGSHSGTKEQLIKDTEQLIDDKEERTKRGEQVFDFAQKEYSKEKSINKLLTLIKETLHE